MHGLLAVLLLAAPASVDKLKVTLVSVTASEQQAALTKVVKHELQPLKGCYDLALKSDPELAGELELAFSFASSQVAQASISIASPIKDETVGQCAIARLRVAQWPKVKDGATVTVRLKLAR